MNLFKRIVLMKTFAIPQFNYCALVLVWMFYSRKPNLFISSIHERALSVTHQDYKSTFLELLKKDNSVTIHQRNLQVLATEIFMAKNVPPPEIMKKIFELKERSSSLLSQGNFFVRGNIKTTHYCIQSIKYLAPNIWYLIPDQIKPCGSLTKSENFFRSLSPSDCPCR